MIATTEQEVLDKTKPIGYTSWGQAIYSPDERFYSAISIEEFEKRAVENLKKMFERKQQLKKAN